MKAEGENPEIRVLVESALAEDRVTEDATSLALVPANADATGRIVARQNGVLSGVICAQIAFELCDPECEQVWYFQDGDHIKENQVVMTCSAGARALLGAERTALNLLQQLSGVATETARLQSMAGGVQVMDTRKTRFGMRDLQKAAVVHGGGKNQRRDLSDELLLKENHFALSGMGYQAAVTHAVEQANGKIVGVEATTKEEALLALSAGADYVLLDNFSTQELPKVVASIRAEFPNAILEASGGFGEHNISALKGSGVNRVSIGSLTHSSAALDLSFYLEVGDKK